MIDDLITTYPQFISIDVRSWPMQTSELALHDSLQMFSGRRSEIDEP
jgi:hypothetical protein